MEQINLQQLYDNMVALEQRLNSLQLENKFLRDQNAAPAVREVAQTDIFRIPDPIKTIPTFDGNKKQLSAWLTTAERTLELFRARVTQDAFSIYGQTIINKIEGKARGPKIYFFKFPDLEELPGPRIGTLVSENWN